MPLIDVRRSTLLVIDMQARLMPAIDDTETIRPSPDAWRRQPYFGVLTRMMQAELPRGRLVYAAVNAHHILLLPDREEDLGLLGPVDEVQLATIAKPDGLEYRVSVRRPAV